MHKNLNKINSINCKDHNVVLPTSAVLFDLDGTLVDTAPDFLAVLIRLCETNNIAPPSPAAVHATVSSGARALVTLAFSISAEHGEFDSLLTALLDDYAQQLLSTQSRLYPDMDRLLDMLEQQGTPWGVVTNKPERFSKPLLHTLGLLSRCATLICPDHVKKTKPDPEPLLLACKRTGSTPAHSIYVGDHPRDIDAGNAAGMTTIAAGFGYLPASPDIRTWGADLIVDSTNDIIEFLWPCRNQSSDI